MGFVTDRKTQCLPEGLESGSQSWLLHSNDRTLTDKSLTVTHSSDVEAGRHLSQMRAGH